MFNFNMSLKKCQLEISDEFYQNYLKQKQKARDVHKILNNKKAQENLILFNSIISQEPNNSNSENMSRETPFLLDVWENLDIDYRN